MGEHTLASLIESARAVKPIPGSLFSIHVEALEEAAARITQLEAEKAELVDLVERSVAWLQDAETDTNWSNPMFGPSPSEEMQAALEATLTRITGEA